jgi:hypothetical protein
MSDEAKLGDVKPEETFKVHDGKEVKNLKQYLRVLKDISEESFRKHVNDQRNDFATWIRHSVGDPVLADVLEKTTDIGETKRIVAERIELLEKRVEIKKIKESLDSLRDDAESSLGIENIPAKVLPPPVPVVKQEIRPEIAPAVAEPVLPPPEQPLTIPARSSADNHPFDVVKKRFILVIRDVLIGFLIGLFVGWIFFSFLAI